jgi:hypothetical protein
MATAMTPDQMSSKERMDYLAKNPIQDLEDRLSGHDITRLVLFIVIVTMAAALFFTCNIYDSKIAALELRIETLEKEKR